MYHFTMYLHVYIPTVQPSRKVNEFRVQTAGWPPSTRGRSVERTQAFRDQPAARARGYRGSARGRLRNVGVVKSILESLQCIRSRRVQKKMEEDIKDGPYECFDA